MVQAINKNHTNATLLNSNEGVKYKFNGTDWIRSDSIKIYRYIDKTKSEVENLINPLETKSGDYLEISKSYNNILLQSESLNDGVWTPKNVLVRTTPDLFVFPDNANPCFNVSDIVSVSVPSEFSIEQQFISNMSKTYIFSVYIKDVNSTDYHYAAISIKDKTYNKMISAKFDLSKIKPEPSEQSEDENQNTSNVTLSDDDPIYIQSLDVKYYDTLSMEEITNTSIIKRYFDTDYSLAKIIRIKIKDEYYYRVYMIFKIKNNTNFTAGVNILDKTGLYVYQPADSIRFYVSGAQLEERGDILKDATSSEEKAEILDNTSVAPYMITFRTEAHHIIPIELYQYVNGSFKLLPENKIHYLDSVVEDIKNKRISSSKPALTDYHYQDIAIIQNFINFGTVASNIINTYDLWGANRLYKINDKIIYMNNLYRCVRTHTSTTSFDNDILNWEIVLDAAGFGNSNNDDTLPLNCIFYDKRIKAYRIKKSTNDGDQWLVLSFKSDELNHRAIVHAMTYGQSRFTTWSEQSEIEPRYLLGFNSGGNYNFVKLGKITNNL